MTNKRCFRGVGGRLRALALVVVLALALAGGAAWAGDELASWQGPARQVLLDYITAVTTPGGPDFIPPAERKAAFDVDGTLIAEKPVFLPLELSFQRLGQVCPQGGPAPEGMTDLCAAHARGDRLALERQYIAQALTKPFVGMGFDEYQAMARRLMDQGVNPANGKPYRRLIYPPMLELIELLHEKGFVVYLCSGSPNFFLRAISADYLGVDPDRCIGTTYQAVAHQSGGRIAFSRGAKVESLNLELQKAVNLLQRLGGPPVLAFGNSDGDSQMLRYALSGRRRGLALLLVHDDPREFVYGQAGLVEALAAEGVVAVSMRQSFRQVETTDR